MTAPDGDLRPPLDLDAIQARADAVTKGPWFQTGRYPQQIMANDDGLVLVAETFTSPQHSPAEAEFITAARTDVPALVARVRELEADARRAFNAIEACARTLIRAEDSAMTDDIGRELLELLGERFVTPEPEQ